MKPSTPLPQFGSGIEPSNRNGRFIPDHPLGTGFRLGTAADHPRLYSVNHL
jgi:hypothetical protein